MLGFLNQFKIAGNQLIRTYKCSKFKAETAHQQVNVCNWVSWNAIPGRRESVIWGIKGRVQTHRAKNISTMKSKPSKATKLSRMKKYNQLYKILRAILTNLIQIKLRLRNSQFLEETTNCQQKLNLRPNKKMTFSRIRDITPWCSSKASSSLTSPTTTKASRMVSSSATLARRVLTEKLWTTPFPRTHGKKSKFIKLKIPTAFQIWQGSKLC